MGMGASTVSAHPAVRDALLDLQRQAGRGGGVVLEGRDVGTVVFPDAEVKFFLTARPEVRARRRFDELAAKGLTTTFEETLEDVRRRDEQDTSRAVAPLKQAADAMLIDGSRAVDRRDRRDHGGAGALRAGTALKSCGGVRPSRWRRRSVRWSSQRRAPRKAPPAGFEARVVEPRWEDRLRQGARALLGGPPSGSAERQDVRGPAPSGHVEMVRRQSRRGRRDPCARRFPGRLGTKSSRRCGRRPAVEPRSSSSSPGALGPTSIRASLSTPRATPSGRRVPQDRFGSSLRDTHDAVGHPDDADDAGGSQPGIGGASLFELPGRTWVIASGEARARARDVLAHPTNRAAIEIDPEALAIVRIDGRSLVARVRPLEESGGLAAVGRRLQVATLVLPPGNDAALRATLAYEDEDRGRGRASIGGRGCRRNPRPVEGEERGDGWRGSGRRKVCARVDKRVTITARRSLSR